MRSLETRCATLIEDLGLGQAGDIRSIAPLTGGVASDIALVDLGHRRICVKFALEKLKVAEEWRAPVHRNRAEYRWLDFAGRVVPGSAPELYGWSEAENGFAMEYVAGAGVVLWKAELLAGRPAGVAAAAVGDALGRIHAAAATEGFDRKGFENRADFDAIRLDPYLAFTAGRHPDLAPAILHLRDALHAASITLVHGDVSPKNILFRAGVPVFLDAECATIGDPAFDCAFCLNHLALKARHLPGARADLLAALGVWWAAYRPAIAWEAAPALEARVARLVPALMLARIDGKSPVEYLDEAARAEVRSAARQLIADPPADLASLARSLARAWGSA